MDDYPHATFLCVDTFIQNSCIFKTQIPAGVPHYDCPVARFLTETLAFGTAAPDGPVIVPESVARHRTRIPSAAIPFVEVQFAGQAVQHKQIAFQRATQGSDTLMTGTIPLTLTDLKIDPPTLLTVPVKNEIPVRVETKWRRM